MALSCTCIWPQQATLPAMRTRITHRKLWRHSGEANGETLKAVEGWVKNGGGGGLSPDAMYTFLLIASLWYHRRHHICVTLRFLLTTSSRFVAHCRLTWRLRLPIAIFGTLPLRCCCHPTIHFHYPHYVRTHRARSGGLAFVLFLPGAPTPLPFTHTPHYLTVAVGVRRERMMLHNHVVLPAVPHPGWFNFLPAACTLPAPLVWFWFDSTAFSFSMPLTHYRYTTCCRTCCRTARFYHTPTVDVKTVRLVEPLRVLPHHRSPYAGR